VHGSDDVDDRIEGAHFVEVHLLQCRPVNGRFRFAQALEQLLRARFSASAQRRAVDELVDFRQ